VITSQIQNQTPSVVGGCSAGPAGAVSVELPLDSVGSSGEEGRDGVSSGSFGGNGRSSSGSTESGAVVVSGEVTGQFVIRTYNQN
jgi:uncharacterized membrane protein YgcG